MDKFIDQLECALEKTKGSICFSDLFRSYEEWDSLAVLSVLAIINDNYGVTIPRKEFELLLTVEDMYNKVLELSDNEKG